MWYNYCSFFIDIFTFFFSSLNKTLKRVLSWIFRTLLFEKFKGFGLKFCWTDFGARHSYGWFQEPVIVSEMGWYRCIFCIHRKFILGYDWKLNFSLVPVLVRTEEWNRKLTWTVKRNPKFGLGYFRSTDIWAGQGRSKGGGRPPPRHPALWAGCRLRTGNVSGAAAEITNRLGGGAIIALPPRKIFWLRPWSWHRIAFVILNTRLNLQDRLEVHLGLSVSVRRADF